MSIPRLAYIVQLDLPGGPIKIGSTKNPRSRFEAFNHGTPVDCRFLGLTLNGIEREPKYFEIACRRIDDAQRQGDFFIEGAA